MNLKLIVSLIFLFSLTSLAQQLSINGVVKDENNQPIAFCNVTLTEVLNKTFVVGTTTNDDGTFIIDNLKPIDYLLKISYLGFESYQDSISLKKNLSIGAIILKEQTQNLEGVTVIAKRPTVQRLADRLIFNVENSTLSNGNVLDVLKNTPGVLVFDGALLIKNSAPTVYMNDRKVHLSATEIQQLLEGSSASNIKSIEVITNPPAKYEAEGGPVLNIIMSKSLSPGYNGSIFGTYKQGEKYPKYSLGTSHFFKSEKIDAYINYNFSPRKDYRHNSETINFIENDQKSSGWETDFKRTRASTNHILNSNIDFK
ncbi:MAG TPA: carboxypeptidase-like regulatory domain-containing protein, partial [Yeosuana sp.]